MEINVFRPNRRGLRAVLGELEAEIMEIVWRQGRSEREAGTTVRDVFERLHRRRPLAYTTVMNTMARLARKGLLRVSKEDQAYLYYPLFSEKEFLSRVAGRILDGLLVGFTGPILARYLADDRRGNRVRKLLAEIAERRREEEER